MALHLSMVQMQPSAISAVAAAPKDADVDSFSPVVENFDSDLAVGSALADALTQE
jgi:hypothetical protein